MRTIDLKAVLEDRDDVDPELHRQMEFQIGLPLTPEERSFVVNGFDESLSGRGDIIAHIAGLLAEFRGRKEQLLQAMQTAEKASAFQAVKISTFHTSGKPPGLQSPRWLRRTFGDPNLN